MTEKIAGKYKNIKELSRAMGLYTSASIFGPLLLIGGIGYILDRYLGTKPIITIISVFIAFVVSNILLFKKTMLLIGHMSELAKKEKEEDK